MVRIKKENINTREWWDGKGFPPVGHESIRGSIIRLESFQRLGGIPTDEEIKVLDIGCGNAAYLPSFKEKFPKATWHGLDISDVRNEKMRQKYAKNENAKFLTADINKDEIEEVYDYIISAHSFEHFEDPVEAIRKCIAKCREKLIICVPYLDAWGKDKSHVHKFTLDDPWSFYESYEIEPGKQEEIFFIFNGEAE